MAGVDEGYLGDAAPARWANIGYLQQEPQLTEVLLSGRRVDISHQDYFKTTKRYGMCGAGAAGLAKLIDSELGCLAQRGYFQQEPKLTEVLLC